MLNDPAFLTSNVMLPNLKPSSKRTIKRIVPLKLQTSTQKVNSNLK